MVNPNSFQSYIFNLVHDNEFLIETAQIQAKALLTEVTEGKLPIEWKWNYLVRRVIRNITAATVELKQLAATEPSKVKELESEARKIALVWEALAHLEESTTKETALINAAVNYELAGYQANAMCIARDIWADQTVSPLSISTMSALFLQRRFVRLLRLTQELHIESPSEDGVDITFIQHMALGLVGQAFLKVVQFFLRGDVALFDASFEEFNLSQELYISLGSVAEANLVQNIKSILKIMKDRATWTLLETQVTNYPRWRRYLQMLARGLDIDALNARSVSELWPSQITAIQKGLLVRGSNKIIRMPTSAGKTRIAELCILNSLINEPSSKCVYVAPYRALVSEVEQSFFGLLNDLGYRVNSVIGNYESSEFEEFLIQSVDVLVLTPEKLDLVLRAKPEFLDNVRLLVLDEGHIVHDASRGIKIELLLTRLKTKLVNAQFLLLSAVVPQETLIDFANWFNASALDDVITSNWRPTIQRYSKFEWRGTTGTIKYALEEEIPRLREFVPGVISQKTYQYVKPETGRRNTKKFPQADKKNQIAAELAFKFAELGPVLIFCTTPDFTESVANALEERLNLAELSRETIPSYFKPSPNLRSIILAEEWMPGHPIVKWLKAGIAVHHGRLPEFVKNAIETDFRQKKLKVLVATSTLAQGVNLPIRTVIMHSCQRYISGAYERIAAREYWNIAGRAGRAGEETEALIIHITLSPNDESDYRYFLSKRQNIEPVKSAIYRLLIDLVQERISEDAIKEKLDPEILALLVEEGVSQETLVQTLIEGSLVQVQIQRIQSASNQLKVQELLKKLLLELVTEITETIPDLKTRIAFSSTGLSSRECIWLREQIVQKKELLQRTLVITENPERDDILDLIIPDCLLLLSPDQDTEINPSNVDLLKLWINGNSLPKLFEEVAEDGTSFEDLTKVIDKVFRYRLPWVISAYLRIVTEVLDIAPDQLSYIARYIPAMVKNGLPEPIACWAMSIGIPIRKTCIDLAFSFKEENTNYNFETFLEWLSNIDSDVLVREYQIPGPLLEDISRTIFTTGRNPLLNQYNNLSEFLPKEVEVKGINYDERFLLARRAQESMTVSLKRDYNNLIDRNAIEVHFMNQQLGFLPRQVSQILAPEMDIGVEFEAIITKVSKIQQVPVVQIQIKLPAP
jgi:superfamily II DNA/RNA helicase